VGTGPPCRLRSRYWLQLWRCQVSEADLEVVNRALGEALRKAEADVLMLRNGLALVIGVLKVAGYYSLADKMWEVLKETER
jgi:hypothetical protein